MAMLETRGVDAELAIRLGIETATAPAGGDDWIAIPFAKGGITRGYTYRRIEKADDGQNFSQDKGGVKQFWNYDAITDTTLADQPLVITEGVFDALAAIQAGFIRTVSVPNGAVNEQMGDRETARYTYVTEAVADLFPIKEIILAVDGDGPGVALMNDLALRLGKARCKYVAYPEGCKDLNDVLRQYGERGVVEALNGAKWVRVKGLFRMSELPPLPETPAYESGIQGLYDHYRLRKADFAVFTGIPGHGKSTFANDLACRMVERHRWKVAFLSPEQAPQEDHRRALRTWFNRKPEDKQSPGELQAADDWIDANFGFIVPDEDEDATVEWVLEMLAAAVIRFGIDMAVVDPWNEMDHARPKDMSLTEYVGWAIRQFKKFAKKWRIHLIVVAHPQKMPRGTDGKLSMPTMYDISDSANWFNKPEVGLIVHRDESGTLIRVAKSRYHDKIGKPGTITLAFNSYTNRFEAA